MATATTNPLDDSVQLDLVDSAGAGLSFSVRNDGVLIDTGPNAFLLQGENLRALLLAIKTHYKDETEEDDAVVRRLQEIHDKLASTGSFAPGEVEVVPQARSVYLNVGHRQAIVVELDDDINYASVAGYVWDQTGGVDHMTEITFSEPWQTAVLSACRTWETTMGSDEGL